MMPGVRGCVFGIVIGVLAAGAASTQGDTPRLLRKTVDVPAPVSTVWRAWTTADWIKSFFAPAANIELKPGGAYEIYFGPDLPYGQRGSEGCTILTYLSEELLAFTWSAPPSIPRLRDSNARTQVIIELLPRDPAGTTVRLTQLGFGEGEDWDKYYEYFDSAWSRVLQQLASIPGEPVSETARPESWQDGRVAVSKRLAPAKRQDFEVLVPASAGDVWHVLTTPEGVRTFFPSNPVIELRPGGKWDLHGGKPNTVMAFIPEEMLAATGSAPDRFPNVQKGGTWGVFRFERAGDSQTRLHLSVVGWQEGDEWDQAFDYFLKANAQFLEMLYRRFAEGPLKQANGDVGRASDAAAQPEK